MPERLTFGRARTSENMDKIIAFLKNKWFRLGISILCYGYTAFLIWVAWLCLGYYMILENPAPLFILYLFVNMASLGLLIYTRKQVVTQVNTFLIPIAVLALLVFGFGHWFIIVPPAVVMTISFFAARSNETLKTVFGTIYLLMFVVGVAAFFAIQMFMGKISFTGVDLSRRDASYEYVSKSGDYRLIRYLQDSGTRKTVSYYVEETKDDCSIPLGECKKVIGSKHLHTAEYENLNDNIVEWRTETVDGNTVDVPYVEGIRKENPYLIKPLEEVEE